MILPKVMGSLFAVGVLAAGTLAGASAFSSGTGPLTSRAVAAERPLAIPAALETDESAPDQLQTYLFAASHLWERTHDARTVRKMLELALEEMDASDGQVGSSEVVGAPSDGHLATDIPRAMSNLSAGAHMLPLADVPHAPGRYVVVQLPEPVAISIASRDLHGQRADWKKRWNTWQASLRKVARLSDAPPVSAIEIAIETW